MQSVALSVVVVALGVVLALVGLHVVRRRFPHPVRQANNEVAGFIITMLGVVYGVILGFMVVVVWQQFEDAQSAAQREANGLVDVFRLALALPASPPARSAISIGRSARTAGTRRRSQASWRRRRRAWQSRSSAPSRCGWSSQAATAKAFCRIPRLTGLCHCRPSGPPC